MLLSKAICIFYPHKHSVGEIQDWVFRTTAIWHKKLRDQTTNYAINSATAMSYKNSYFFSHITGSYPWKWISSLKVNLLTITKQVKLNRSSQLAHLYNSPTDLTYFLGLKSYIEVIFIILLKKDLDAKEKGGGGV